MRARVSGMASVRTRARVGMIVSVGYGYESQRGYESLNGRAGMSMKSSVGMRGGVGVRAREGAWDGQCAYVSQGECDGQHRVWV